MSQDKHSSGKVALDATRKALAAVHDPAIRDDLLHVISGVETCLAHEHMYLSIQYARAVTSAVFVLRRTLSPAIAVGILDGLQYDSETSARALQRGLGFTKNFDERCKISGGPIGSSTCVEQKNSTCYQADGGTGCGGPSGFHFVFEAAAVSGETSN